jgi:hypothetical protein
VRLRIDRRAMLGLNTIPQADYNVAGLRLALEATHQPLTASDPAQICINLFVPPHTASQTI